MPGKGGLERKYGSYFAAFPENELIDYNILKNVMKWMGS